MGAGPMEVVRGGVFDDEDGGVVSGRAADVGEQVAVDPLQQTDRPKPTDAGAKFGTVPQL